MDSSNLHHPSSHTTSDMRKEIILIINSSHWCPKAHIQNLCLIERIASNFCRRHLPFSTLSALTFVVNVIPDSKLFWFENNFNVFVTELVIYLPLHCNVCSLSFWLLDQIVFLFSHAQILIVFLLGLHLNCLQKGSSEFFNDAGSSILKMTSRSIMPQFVCTALVLWVIYLYET